MIARVIHSYHVLIEKSLSLSLQITGLIETAVGL